MAEVAVIGAGAVGLFYGALLQRAGHTVTFQSASGARPLARRPLEVTSLWGDFRLKVRVVADPAGLTPAGLVLVCVKALPAVDYKRLLSPVVRSGSIILLLQNGIGNDERLAALFPGATVLAGLAFTCINRISPERVVHSGYGLINVGARLRTEYRQGRETAALLAAAGIKCAFGGDTRILRWKKLLWNVPFNCLSVVLGGVTTDRMMASPPVLELVRQLMGEVRAVARADGARLTFKDISTMLDNTRAMQPYKTSMMIDHELGRPMEVDAILGEVVRIARRKHVPVPAMETLWRMLRFYDGS